MPRPHKQTQVAVTFLCLSCVVRNTGGAVGLKVLLLGNTRAEETFLCTLWPGSKVLLLLCVWRQVQKVRAPRLKRNKKQRLAVLTATTACVSPLSLLGALWPVARAEQLVPLEQACPGSQAWKWPGADSFLEGLCAWVNSLSLFLLASQLLGCSLVRCSPFRGCIECWLWTIRGKGLVSFTVEGSDSFWTEWLSLSDFTWNADGSLSPFPQTCLAFSI